MWRRWAMTALFAGAVFLYFMFNPEARVQLTGGAGGDPLVSPEIVGGTVSAAFAALLNFLLPSLDVIVVEHKAEGLQRTSEESGAPTPEASREESELTERRRDVVAMRLALACALCMAFASFVATVSMPPPIGVDLTDELAAAMGRKHGIALSIAYFSVAAGYGVFARWTIDAGLFRALRLGGISALCVNLSALLIALPYRMSEHATDVEFPLEIITWTRLVVLPVVAGIACMAGAWVAGRIWKRAAA